MDINNETIAITGMGAWIIIREGINFISSRSKEKAETQALTSEATAKTGIIEVLERRIAAQAEDFRIMQSRVNELEQRLNAEHELRLQAKEENALLRIRVRQLEFALANAGIPLPTELMNDVKQLT